MFSEWSVSEDRFILEWVGSHANLKPSEQKIWFLLVKQLKKRGDEFVRPWEVYQEHYISHLATLPAQRVSEILVSPKTARKRSRESTEQTAPKTRATSSSSAAQPISRTTSSASLTSPSKRSITQPASSSTITSPSKFPNSFSTSTTPINSPTKQAYLKPGIILKAGNVKPNPKQSESSSSEQKKEESKTADKMELEEKKESAQDRNEQAVESLQNETGLPLEVVSLFSFIIAPC